MNKMIKNTLSITLITIIAGLLLGLVYTVTKSPIANAKYNAEQSAYKRLISNSDKFEELKDFNLDDAAELLKENKYTNDIITDVIVATSKSETIGYIINVTSKEGFGGDIELSVGILSDGTVAGVEILSISETAGLGMKASEDTFLNQFKDITTDSFSYTTKGSTSDSMIDAISGATITTNAVTNAVNSGLCYFNQKLKGE